jgi:hypothetical protein
VGWFKRDAGRHSAYGVPDVTARLAARAAVPLVSPPEIPSARLPDDRTTEQIGEKVADVLWNYYGQQPAAPTPLVESPVAAATPTYDDTYDSALLDFPELATPPVQPVPWERGFQPLLQPWPEVPKVAPAAVTPIVAAPPPAAPPTAAPPPVAPPPAPPRFRVFERVAAPAPTVLPVVTAPVAAPRVAAVVAPVAPVEQAAQSPEWAPEPTPVLVRSAVANVPVPAMSRLAVLESSQSGVQLGFVDGTTLDLPRDDPAAKALRAAADALTLRE